MSELSHEWLTKEAILHYAYMILQYFWPPSTVSCFMDGNNELTCKKAEEDFQVALLLAKKIKVRFLNSICFHSQQAAEKYFKAYLSKRNKNFPKTHDLIILKKICMEIDSSFELLSDLVLQLNPYSVEFRYPGEEATRKEAKHALAIVQEIRRFILNKI